MSSPIPRTPLRPARAGALEACARIERWLLHSGVQLGHGEHRGGIAGWLDADGRPEFVYPEIAGYYLTTTGWLAAGGAGSRESVAAAAGRGRRAAGWLARSVAGGSLPATRLYLSPRPADWRNEAVFTFDLAMAARGLDAAPRPTWPGRRRPPLARLCAALAEISPDTDLLASHRSATNLLPERWSTRPGPHHLKAAAAILRLPATAVDPALARTCRRTCAHWAQALTEPTWPCAHVHTLLYGLEGMLMAAGPDERAAAVFTRLMERQARDGTLPESVDGGPVRSDVLAQALRVGLLLRAHGLLAGPAWGERLDALATSLLGYVQPDGGVRFADHHEVSNTWCAMFAHQALALHGHGPRLAATALGFLV